MKQTQTRTEQELQKYQQGYLEMVETLSKYKTVEDDFYVLQQEAVENRLALEKQLEDAEILSQQQLDDIRQEHARIIQELTASSKSLLDACEARLVIAERKRGDAEEELKRVLEQLAKHQEIAFNCSIATAELEKRIKDLELERRQALDESDSAAVRHKEETQRAESVAQEVKVLTAELNDLQQRLEAAEAGKKEARARGHESLMQVEAADQQVKALTDRLNDTTQEMDAMMIEIGYLQTAVAEQNNQYRLISQQLMSARALIQEFESPVACSSASLDPASGKLHDKEVTRRALSWLAVFDMKPNTPTALANSSNWQALEKKSPNKKAFSIISTLSSYG
jgi:chromosome segregation ATPase